MNKKLKGRPLFIGGNLRRGWLRGFPLYISREQGWIMNTIPVPELGFKYYWKNLISMQWLKNVIESKIFTYISLSKGNGILHADVTPFCWW